MHPYETNRKCLEGTVHSGAGVTSDFLSGNERVPFSDHHQWKKFSSNMRTHCAIDVDGKLWAWGAPPVGDGTLLYRPEPVLISSESWKDVSVAHSFIDAVVIGDPPANTPEQWGSWNGKEIGRTSVLAVKEDGTLWGWGSNVGGVLGNGGASSPAVVFARMRISSPIKSVTSRFEDGLLQAIEEAGGDVYKSLEVAKHDPAKDPGSGAEFEAQIAREILSLNVTLSSGSLTAAPAVEVYAVDKDESEVEIDQEKSTPADLSVEMEYTVTGVTWGSSRPYRGNVVVAIFSEGKDGNTAEAECFIGDGGYLESIQITKGGKYSSLPSVAFYGSGGEVIGASVVVSGLVKSVSVASGGLYRDRNGEMRSLRVRFDPEVASATVHSAPRLLGVGVKSEGSGYTAPSGRPLKVAVDVTALGGWSGQYQSLPGVTRYAEIVTLSVGPDGILSPYAVGNKRGVVLGECDLGPSSVADAHVPERTQYEYASGALMTPKGRIRVPDDFVSRSQPQAIEPFSQVVVVEANSGVPQAVIVWPGTTRQAVQLGIKSLEYDSPTYAAFEISLSNPIENAFSEARPLLKIVYRASPPMWNDNYTKKPDGGLEKEIGTAAIPAYWAPGMQWREVNGGGSTFENLGRFALGDIMKDSGLGRHVIRGVNRVTGGNSSYPLVDSAYARPERATYQWLDGSAPGVNGGLFGFLLDKLSPHYAGGETTGVAATVEVEIDDSGFELGSLESFPFDRLMKINVDEAGSGYTSEPIAAITSIYLSPAFSGQTQAYKSVVASSGCAYGLTQGGDLFEWGMSSMSGSLRPSRRGYPLVVTIDTTGAPSTFTDLGPDAFSEFVTHPFEPQTSSFSAPTPSKAEGQFGHAVKLRTDDVGSSSVAPINYGAVGSGNSWFRQDGLSDQQLWYPWSQRSPVVGGPSVTNVKHASTACCYVDSPAVSGDVPATAEVIKPAHPIQSIHDAGAGSLVVVDVNNHSWLLRTSHYSGFAQADGPDWIQEDVAQIPVVTSSGTATTRYGRKGSSSEYFVELTSSQSQEHSLPSAYGLYGTILILVPDTPDGLYPMSEIQKGATVKLHRNGGKCALVYPVKRTWSTQQVSGPPPGDWQSEEYRVYETVHVLNGPQVEVLDIPNAVFEFGKPFQTEFISKPVAQGSISMSALVSGSFLWQARAGRLTHANWAFGAFPSLATYGIQPTSAGNPTLGTGDTAYFSELPSYSLTVTQPSGQSQTVPLRVMQVRRIANGSALQSCVKLTELPNSGNSQNTGVTISGPGLIASRPGVTNGLSRGVVSAGPVSGISPSGVCICPTGIRIIEGDSTVCPPHVSNLEVTVTDGGSGFTSIPRIVPSYTPPELAEVTATIDGRVKSIGIEKSGAGFFTPPNVIFEGGYETEEEFVGIKTPEAEAIIEGGLFDIQVTSAGSGYAVPPVVLLKGKGVHGTAIASINSAGSVSSISVASNGRYRSPPEVELVPRFTPAAINVTSNGSEYTHPPAVHVCPSRGESAAASIDGRVVDVVVLVGGSGYSGVDPPEVIFSDPQPAADGVAGVRARGIAIVEPLSGAIIGVNIIDRGSGYQSAPSVSVDGGGASLAARISGGVRSVTITSVGSGFFGTPGESLPTVVALFSGGGGVGAAAQVVLSQAGGGATAEARISGEVIAVKIKENSQGIRKEGGGYQFPPDVFFAGGDDGKSTAALLKLRSEQISRAEYDSLDYIPVAHAKIEGFIDDVVVERAGSRYTQHEGIVGSSEADSLPLSISEYHINRRFGADGYGVSPILVYHGLTYPEGGGLFGAKLFWRDSYDLGGFDHMIGPMHPGTVFAEPSYPGGGLRVGSHACFDKMLYSSKPTIAPLNGHLFCVDSVENARSVAYGFRRSVAFTSTIAGSASTGLVTNNLPRYWLAISDLQGKQINTPTVIGSSGSEAPITFLGGLSLRDFSFEKPPLFTVEDVTGKDATLTSQTDAMSRVSGVSFGQQGTDYTEHSVIAIPLDNLPRLSNGWAETQCSVDSFGRVSHIAAIGKDYLFLNPVVVIHGGRGSGCSARAVTKTPGKPSAVVCIEVVSQGYGYSPDSPPLAYVYEAGFDAEKLALAFNEAAKGFPIVPLRDSIHSERVSSPRSFAVFSSGKITHATTLPSTGHNRRSLEDANQYFARSWRGTYVRFGGEFYKENDDLLSLPVRPVVDTFSRFDRIMSVRHRSPPLPELSFHYAAGFGHSEFPYDSPPGLSFVGPKGYSDPAASCSLVTVDPNSAFFGGIVEGQIASNKYLASRQQ